jgi:methyl-accepting chemotaxis protein
VLQHFEKLAEAGTLTKQQAQASAISTIKGLRYGQSNYYWINDAQPRMIMHPTNPALDRTDLSTYKDPNGFALFVAMANLCKAKGEGRVAYMWNKPGSTTPVPKISFVKLYAPWGWIVGAGIYMDDVEAGQRPSLRDAYGGNVTAGSRRQSQARGHEDFDG